MFTLPVQHEGRLLGEVSVTVPPGRSLSAPDQRLLADLANQAGLVLSNLGLTADLIRSPHSGTRRSSRVAARA